jgi:threonine dehydratase
VLKLEYMQHTGTFKARGAFNSLLSLPVPEAGVITASGGNHGAAVAYAAGRLGHRAEVFAAETAPRVKVERIRRYGAEVFLRGSAYSQAMEACLERARATGARLIHAYDQPETVAGQGTAFREFDAQAPGLDAVLVAVGGGGLIAGALAWYGRRIRIVAVEPERAPTLARALEAGRPVDVEVSGIAADSLGARRIGAIAFAMARQALHASVLVSEEEIGQAQRVLWEKLRIATEPGGAAATAALLSGRWRPAPGERVGVLVCGANVDLGLALGPVPEC